jgi:hypothetical protein
VLCAALAVAGATLFGPVRHSAAQVSSTSTHGNHAGVQLTLRGQVQSSISIAVEGSADNGATTTITGSGIQGVVNFGVYDLPGPLITGEKHRVNKNPKGNYLVATLTASTRYSGPGGLAAIDIQRANVCAGPPDVSCAAPGYFFYAKMTPRKPNQKNLAWPKWNEPPGGAPMPGVFLMPLSTHVPDGNLDSQMQSGESIDHQVGIWIPDSQAPGPFSTVVTYTATRL